MNIIANQDKIGTSNFDLYFYTMLYWLTFKKVKWFKKQIVQITKDLETVKSRSVF